jgi:hypothetical protein
MNIILYTTSCKSCGKESKEIRKLIKLIKDYPGLELETINTRHDFDKRVEHAQALNAMGAPTDTLRSVVTFPKGSVLLENVNEFNIGALL